MWRSQNETVGLGIQKLRALSKEKHDGWQIVGEVDEGEKPQLWGNQDEKMAKIPTIRTREGGQKVTQIDDNQRFKSYQSADEW